jgi:hypothetical protein
MQAFADRWEWDAEAICGFERFDLATDADNILKKTKLLIKQNENRMKIKHK